MNLGEAMPVTVHVFLQDTNAIKIHTVRERTKRSANEIVNQLFNALEAIEIEEIITLHIKDPDGGAPRKVRKVRKYKVNFDNINM